MIEKTIRHNGRPWHVREFGLNELLNMANDPPHPKNADHHTAVRFRSNDNRRQEWTGASIQEARTLRTWPAGRAMMDTINLDGCELPAPKTRRRVRCWADDGDEFNRDRFDAGLDDCWQARRPRSVVGGNTVRLTIELGANVTRSGESLIWSGAAAAKLIDGLETAGYRVEIGVTHTSCNVNRSGTYHTVTIVHVKQAPEPLNLDGLLLSAAHPAFYRFHMFAERLRLPIRVKDTLGNAMDTPEPLRGDVHIAKVFDRASAERLVRSELKKRSAEV